MKTWMYSLVIVVLVLVAGSMLSSVIMNREMHGHHGVYEKIKNVQGEEVIGVSSVKHLPNLDTLILTEQGREFAISKRESQIQSFACSECHSEDLNSLKAELPDAGKKSHWNIEMQHAGGKMMNCTTCHSEENMDNLHTITGESIGFDNSYQVCAQCHQGQYKDWAGGAHGKRKGGWAKPVVKYTCVECHNPHKPGFPHKLPSRINSRMIEQRAHK